MPRPARRGRGHRRGARSIQARVGGARVQRRHASVEVVQSSVRIWAAAVAMFLVAVALAVPHLQRLSQRSLLPCRAGAADAPRRLADSRLRRCRRAADVRALRRCRDGCSATSPAPSSSWWRRALASARRRPPLPRRGWRVRRSSASASTLLEILASPRSYSYPKMLFYGLAGCVIVAVAAQASRARLDHRGGPDGGGVPDAPRSRSLHRRGVCGGDRAQRSGSRRCRATDGDRLPPLSPSCWRRGPRGCSTTRDWSRTSKRESPCRAEKRTSRSCATFHTCSSPLA